jgi:hypothetical protein
MGPTGCRRAARGATTSVQGGFKGYRDVICLAVFFCTCIGLAYCLLCTSTGTLLRHALGTLRWG